MKCVLGMMWGVGLAVLSLVGCAGAGTYRTWSGQQVTELRVVRTWPELMRQPVVGQGDEAVRLGIEADRCEEGSGVLVYCVPVSPKLNAGAAIEGEALGPVSLRMIAPGANPAQGRSLKALEDRSGTSAPAFYAAAARVAGPGNYEVQVVGRDGNVLAATRVKAAIGPGMVWTTFGSRTLSKEPGGSVYTWSNTAATPAWDGEDELAKMDALPRFVPAAADPGLKVSAQDGLVTVHCQKWADRDVPEHWMIRWWVNGNPIVGKAGVRKEFQDEQNMAEKITEPMDFSFHLDVDRAALGAKVGDAVEFQLLYSRHGLWFDRTESIAKIWEDTAKDASPVRISNRARWE